MDMILWLLKGKQQIIFMFFIYLPAEKANANYYSNRQTMIEMSSKSSLPMEAMDLEPAPSNPYSPPRQLSAKPNGHKYKSSRSRSSQSLCYSSNTAVSPGVLRSWDSKDAVGLRQSYGQKKLCIIEKELQTTRYMPPQPYFVTNSKTEVTVWEKVWTSQLRHPEKRGARAAVCSSIDCSICI